MFRKILFPLILLSVFPASAQNFFGLQNSNWAGVNAIYINPAGIADSRHRQHTNIAALGMNVVNDYVSLEAPFSVTALMFGNVDDKYKDTAGHINWDPSWLKENLNGEPKNFYMGAELRGPAYMMRLGSKSAIAIGTRVRTGIVITNVSEDLIQFGKALFDSTAPSFIKVKDNSFAANMNAYQEISLAFATVLYNKKFFYWKGGITGKYLMSLASAYAINDGIEFETRGNDTLVINHSNLSMGHSNLDILNRMAEPGGLLRSVIPSFKNFTGSGLGFDLGAIFEYRPALTDKVVSQNKYLLKGGISLLDIGIINISQKVSTYKAGNTTPVYFTGDSAMAAAFAKGSDSGFAYLEQYAKDNFNYTKGEGRYSINIPRSLNIQLDWNILKTFYLGLNWTQSLVGSKDIAFRKPSAVTLIPRFESKLFEAALPVSLYNDYNNFGLGAYLRLGPLFVGTDNLIKVAGGSKMNGFDFYFGVSTGIPAKKAAKK